MSTVSKNKSDIRYLENLDAGALLSNLRKTVSKSVLLQESPWLLNARESEAKRIALLFDLNTMGNELSRALTA